MGRWIISLPSCYHYHSFNLCSRYSATGKIDRAEELLKEMKRVGVPIDNNLVKTVEARKRRFILFGDEILKTVGRTF